MVIENLIKVCIGKAYPVEGRPRVVSLSACLPLGAELPWVVEPGCASCLMKK